MTIFERLKNFNQSFAFLKVYYVTNLSLFSATTSRGVYKDTKSKLLVSTTPSATPLMEQKQAKQADGMLSSRYTICYTYATCIHM